MVTWSCKIFKIYFCIFLLKELPSLKWYKLWVPENLDFLWSQHFTSVYHLKRCLVKSHIFSLDSYRNSGSQRLKHWSFLRLDDLPKDTPIRQTILLELKTRCSHYECSLLFHTPPWLTRVALAWQVAKVSLAKIKFQILTKIPVFFLLEYMYET